MNIKETGRNTTIEGFEVETRFNMKFAVCKSSARYTEVDFNEQDEVFYVHCEEGRAHTLQQTKATIPLAVIAEILQASGWSITRNS